jgi:hypothetical protein
MNTWRMGNAPDPLNVEHQENNKEQFQEDLGSGHSDPQPQ